MPDSGRSLVPLLVRAALGSLAGAAVGYFAFVLVARQGRCSWPCLALAGIGCGLATRTDPQAAAWPASLPWSCRSISSGNFFRSRPTKAWVISSPICTRRRGRPG